MAEQPSSSPQDDISVKNECESETRVVRGLRVIRGLRFDCAPYSEIRGGMQLKHAPVIQGSTDARAFSVTFEIVEGSEDDVANDVGYARQKAEDAALRSVGCLVAEEPNKLVAEKNLPHTNELDGTEFQLCLIDARTEDKIGAASKGGPLPIFSTQVRLFNYSIELLQLTYWFPADRKSCNRSSKRPGQLRESPYSLPLRQAPRWKARSKTSHLG